MSNTRRSFLKSGAVVVGEGLAAAGTPAAGRSSGHHRADRQDGNAHGMVKEDSPIGRAGRRGHAHRGGCRPYDGVYVGMFPEFKHEVRQNAEIVHRILVTT